MNREYLELSDFSPEIYRISPDLRGLSNDELAQHYLRYGVDEGRFFNTIVDRKSFIRSIEKKGRMLEVSPKDHPLLDSRSANYFSIDGLNTDQLAGFQKNNYRFSCILATHQLERMPDMVRFFRTMGDLLENSGSLNLIITDKRYGPDHYQAPTTPFQAIEAYYDSKDKPSLADVLRMELQSTHDDTEKHWTGLDHGGDGTRHELSGRYPGILESYKKGEHRDVRVNQFTPRSFLEIVTVLVETKLINLRVHRIYHTLRGSMEFYVILRKNNKEL